MEIKKVHKVLDDGHHVRICKECKGKGEVPEDEFGSGHSDMETCPSCWGTGRTKVVMVKCEIRVPYDWKLKK